MTGRPTHHLEPTAENSQPAIDQPPRITGVVVHWHNEAQLAELVDSWPKEPHFELVVVNNGSQAPLPKGDYRLIDPGLNLGFAGGVNAGVEAARAPYLLLLNPDARPLAGALEELLRGMATYPGAAGLAPRLTGVGGESQYRWQLRPLPSPWRLMVETLFVMPSPGPVKEPASGTRVEQPAAAALLLRREALSAAGGLDEGFYPAWFEDVDLAKRLNALNLELRYWPAAHFHHDLGASVPRLGYGDFLWTYQRNQHRYVAKHHGAAAAALLRLATFLGMVLRLLLLPLRRPRRAASRRSAAHGLLGAAAGALSGWRRPHALASTIAQTAARRRRESP